jgi:hypothetical protein
LGFLDLSCYLDVKVPVLVPWYIKVFLGEQTMRSGPAFLPFQNIIKKQERILLFAPSHDPHGKYLMMAGVGFKISKGQKAAA